MHLIFITVAVKNGPLKDPVCITFAKNTTHVA